MSSRAESNRLRRILVGTDGSPAARDAVAFAVDLASEHGSELIIVHVVPLVDVFPPPTIYEVGEAFPHVPRAHDHELLQEAASMAAEQGVVAATALVPGSPVDEILSYSESHDADLVVVGSHGHGAVVSALHGSVARGVMHAARRSVLIVRPTHLTSTTYT
jgi:nucleotide-binding universal stress UspA family protein